jgi:hypothetical protein
MATAGLEVRSRTRVHIRARESKSTLSAWRVELVLPEGQAAMVLAELDPQHAWYRAEGALLGASQERLAALWKECLPQGEPDSGGFQQLG